MGNDWQQRMDAAFEGYYALSPSLNLDVEYLLRVDDQSQPFRRNFIRAACSLIEGYLSCFRELCAIGLESGQGTLTKKEYRALVDEKSLDSVDRTKFTIRAIYKMFELESVPDFGDSGWESAQLLLKRRDGLVHPKSADQFEIDDDSWEKIYDGAIWVFTPLLKFVERIALKHGI